MDTDLLRRAAAIEVALHAAYAELLAMPFIGGSSALPLLARFFTTTTSQHEASARRFNTAALAAGASAQHTPDPVALQSVAAARPTLGGPVGVVGLAITLEELAAQTYVRATAAVGTPDLRSLFLSIASVAAQREAVLRLMQALLTSDDTGLMPAGADLTRLPAAVGSVGFPAAFYPTRFAPAADEGAR